MAELDRTIHRLRRRLWAVAAIRSLALCLLGALAAATVVALADRLVWLGLNAIAVAAGLIALAVPAALVLARSRGRVTAERAATEADRALGLSDRLGSAVSLRSVGGPWADAVVHDAEARARGADVARAFPLRATVAARLLVPAAVLFVVVMQLPQADLLGRLQREVTRRLAAGAAAEESAEAVAAAGAGAWPELGSQGPDEGVGSLRVKLVQVGKELSAQTLPDATRLELAERLRRLAERMNGREGAERLAAEIRRAADALAKGDKDAAAALRALERELARMERALTDVAAMDGDMRRLADARLAGLRAAASPAAEARQPAGVVGPAENLVELSSGARKPPDRSGTGGIIYSPATTGVPAAGSAQAYEDASRRVAAEIEAGAIPAGYVRLVREYFDSIKPAERR